MTRSTIIAGIASLLGSFCIVGESSAASYDHVDRLALRIQKRAVEIEHEVKLHFRHTREFGHLLSDAAQLNRRAYHVHEVAHAHGSLHHLSSDLRELDRLFHHLEQLISDVERSAHFYRGAGHVDGDTRHLKPILKRMANDLHHLQEDIEEMSPRRVNYHSRGRDHGHQNHRATHRGWIGPTFTIRW